MALKETVNSFNYFYNELCEGSFKNASFIIFSIFVLMSEQIPKVSTGSCGCDIDSEEERLRIRKNCILQ